MKCGIKKNAKRGSNILFVLFLYVLFSLSCSLIHTSNTSATVSTLSLSVTDKVSLNVSATNSEGIFATSDLNTNNISVTTNNGTGYMLGIKANTEGGNALVNETDSSKTIPSHTISAGVSKTNYNDSSYASANNLNNTWGFRPSKYYDIANEVTIDNTTSNLYFPGPSSATNQFIIDKTTSANTTANEYNIALGTRINSSTAPGKYTDTFIITAVANPTIYSITYNQNTTDTVTNMPTNVVNQPTFDETTNISSTIPVRDGFNFKGWCTVQVADGGTCTGTTYNPDGGGTNLTWTLDQTISSNSLTLYAMWANSCIGKTTLYELVSCRSKGTQNLAQFRAAITADNSGVYEYNSSVFGNASDAANTSKIYYYRGILDNTTGTYGSDGDNAAHPNTVVLSSASSKSGLTTNDTCWRIIRTTGSGGVKMIYQGKWTGSTCANSTSAAQVTTLAFNTTSNIDDRGIIAIGYTFNPSYKTTKTDTAYSTLFGSNASYSDNSTNSTMKTYIEGTWFTNINSYASKLESSAGYCNDRTLNSGTSWTIPVSDDYSIRTPYTSSSSDFSTYYFGAYPRFNGTTTSLKPTLGCPRNGADLYTTPSASNGNKQLTKPVALLTADEAAFAGSGHGSSSAPYHTNSFLNSGSWFWLLSPYGRISDGCVRGSLLGKDGYLSFGHLSSVDGVRPSISLIPGITPISGSGKAADPWIINSGLTKNYMQDVTDIQLANLMPDNGDSATLYDKRDENDYQVTKINGRYWMTQSLRITHTNGQSLGTILAENSNFNNNITFNGDLTSGNSYTAKRYHVPNETDLSTLGLTSEQIGVWYNYCAVSAGTICNSTDTVSATQDICPAGWRLPTSDELSSITSSANIFSPSLSRYYTTGALADSHVGYWWSSDYSSATAQVSFRWTGSALSVRSTNKRLGLAVRCIKNNN